MKNIFRKEIVKESDIGIYDLGISTKNKIELGRLKEGEKISIMSDTMLKTMLGSESRKEYLAKLLSYIINYDYDYIYNHLKYYKNELDKKYENDKSEKCDIILELDGKYINIEVNNNSSYNTIERNIEYVTRIFSMKTKKGNSYDYSSCIQINFNNFSYEGSRNIINLFNLKNNEGQVLSNKINIVTIDIPKIREKCYNSNNKLTGFERCILTMVERNIEKAKEISRKDTIMEKYIDDAENACREEELIEAYDKEWALRDEGEREGIKIGEREGIKIGEQKERIKNAKAMVEEKIDINIISKVTGLSIEEIKKLF